MLNPTLSRCLCDDTAGYIRVLLLLLVLFLTPTLTRSALAQSRYCPKGRHNVNETRCPVHGVATVVRAGPKPVPKKVPRNATTPKTRSREVSGATPAPALVQSQPVRPRSTPTSNARATADLREALEDSRNRENNPQEILRRVTSALNRGAAVNTTNSVGDTALLWASNVENEPLVRLLLSKNAAVNQANNSGFTPLMYAAAGSAAITRLLLQKGAAVNARSKSGLTALMTATLYGALDCAKLLAFAGAEVNSKTGDGTTALVLAVSEDKKEMVDFLLEEGATVNLTFGKNATTPLIAAASYEDLKNRHAIARALLNAGARVNVVDASKHTPLHYAARRNDTVMVKMLLAVKGIELNRQCVSGFTPLMEAAEVGATETATQLVKAGADTKIKDREGNTALAIAENKGNDGIVSLLRGGDTVAEAPDGGEVEKSPRSGNRSTDKPTPAKESAPKPATPNATATVSLKEVLDTNGTFNSRWEAMRAALEDGADVNTQGASGETALFQACIGNNLEAVRYLLGRGADVNLGDKDKNVPLHPAALRNNVALTRLLLGVEGIQIDAADSSGWNALMYGIDGQGREVVKILLDAGADPNFQNAEGYGPIHLACWVAGANSNPDGGAEIVKMLLDSKRVSLEAKTKKGNTPLIYACAYGRLAVVRLLLERGADVNAKSEGGLTPLLVASEPATMAQDMIRKSENLSESGKEKLLKQLEANFAEIVKLLKARGATG